jgi:hypothetical protein
MMDHKTVSGYGERAINALFAVIHSGIFIENGCKNC